MAAAARRERRAPVKPALRFLFADLRDLPRILKTALGRVRAYVLNW